jgi:bacterioferritin-associated ferredoxin
MLVCHCLAIREREIRFAIAQGAATPREIAQHCGAGARCGGCLPLIEEFLAAQTAGRAELARERANECALSA